MSGVGDRQAPGIAPQTAVPNPTTANRKTRSIAPIRSNTIALLNCVNRVNPSANSGSSQGTKKLRRGMSPQLLRVHLPRFT